MLIKLLPECLRHKKSNECNEKNRNKTFLWKLKSFYLKRKKKLSEF